MTWSVDRSILQREGRLQGPGRPGRHPGAPCSVTRGQWGDCRDLGPTDGETWTGHGCHAPLSVWGEGVPCDGRGKDQAQNTAGPNFCFLDAADFLKGTFVYAAETDSLFLGKNYPTRTVRLCPCGSHSQPLGALALQGTASRPFL